MGEKKLEYGYRFAALKERYANIITVLQYGHNHDDFVEITQSFADKKPLLLGFSNPSLTTYFDNSYLLIDLKICIPHLEYMKWIPKLTKLLTLPNTECI